MALDDAWDKARASVDGLGDVHFHDLRHAGATGYAPGATSKELQAASRPRQSRRGDALPARHDERDAVLAEAMSDGCWPRKSLRFRVPTGSPRDTRDGIGTPDTLSLLMAVFNGRTSAFQADDASSILVGRSNAFAGQTRHLIGSSFRFHGRSGSSCDKHATACNTEGRVSQPPKRPANSNVGGGSRRGQGPLRRPPAAPDCCSLLG